MSNLDMYRGITLILAICWLFGSVL